MTVPWYARREDVKAALDVKMTARSDFLVDRAIAAASRNLDGGRNIGGLLHRRFYPEVATREVDWPTRDQGSWWIRFPHGWELVSLTSLTVGGTTVTVGDVKLYPLDGPPYHQIQVLLSSSASFGSGDTHQGNALVNGLWGYDDESEPAGALAAALSTATATSVVVTDGSTVGVGDVLKAGTERMIVTGRGASVDTGQDTTGALAAQASADAVPVGDGTGFAVGEVVTVGTERMLVVDVVGNTLTVRRAWDGTTLAAHSTGADVYASRAVTVERGSLGTTAAAHSTGAALTRMVIPGPVRELCEDEAVGELLGKQHGHSRTVGSGDNEREASGRGLARKRLDVYASHGRKQPYRGGV